MEFEPFQAKYIVDKVDRNYTVVTDLTLPTRFALDKEETELHRELSKVTVSIQKFALVYKIPSDKVDKTLQIPDSEYYRVDIGMNINVPQGKIKELRYYLSILADGKLSGDAFAIDGFPKDVINHVTIIAGKVKLAMNKLLKIIPLTAPIADLIEIEINPWEIEWGYDKLQIGFSEGQTNELDWYLSKDNVNQSFTCYFTLKKKKSVKEVKLHAKAIWSYEPHNAGVKAWLKRRFGKEKVPLTDDEKEVQVIP